LSERVWVMDRQAIPIVMLWLRGLQFRIAAPEIARNGRDPFRRFWTWASDAIYTQRVANQP
jgi:hypothetical protein